MKHKYRTVQDPYTGTLYRKRTDTTDTDDTDTDQEDDEWIEPDELEL